MMKTKMYFFLLLALLFVSTSCEEELTPNQVTEAALISAPWKLSNVKVDGVASNLYSGLQLTFSKGGYTAVNGGDIWGNSGTWSFTGTDGKVISTGTGLSIELVSATKTGLTISFSWDKTIYDKGSRMMSLKGKHEMTFSPGV